MWLGEVRPRGPCRSKLSPSRLLGPKPPPRPSGRRRSSSMQESLYWKGKGTEGARDCDSPHDGGATGPRGPALEAESAGKPGLASGGVQKGGGSSLLQEGAQLEVGGRGHRKTTSFHPGLHCYQPSQSPAKWVLGRPYFTWGN